MDWRDEGLVLAVRPHGEGGAVAVLLTRDHGRHAGLVHGARSARTRGQWAPGNRMAVTWRARLEDHLGRFEGEALSSASARIMEDGDALEALSAACALIELALPERETAPPIYAATAELFDLLGTEDWPVSYVRWEIGLLAELGFGLDLARCAVTGGRDDLVWVSPRTGRAVSADAGAPWADRLLVLPGFLLGQGPADRQAIADGLRLSGHFIDAWLLHPGARRLPAARHRLLERWTRAPTTSGMTADHE